MKKVHTFFLQSTKQHYLLEIVFSTIWSLFKKLLFHSASNRLNLRYQLKFLLRQLQRILMNLGVIKCYNHNDIQIMYYMFSRIPVTLLTRACFVLSPSCTLIMNDKKLSQFHRLEGLFE